MSPRATARGPSGGPTVPSCFDPKVRLDLADLTRRFTHDLMNGDGEENLDYLAENFVYIASSPNQPSYDRDEYLAIARAICEDDVRIVLLNQSFLALPVRGDYCCVLALFRVFLGKGSNSAELRGASARLCYHWSLADGEPRLLVLESSFALGIDDLAGFGGAAEGAMDFRPPDPLQDDWLLEFRDDRRISHFVSADGIRYVEARGHKSAIHCLEDVFEVNEGISSVEERLGPNFVRLHRSYLVNPWHLRTLSEQGATLDDGEVLPVPARRLEELRETLRWVRKPRSDLDGIGSLLWEGRF